MHFDLTDLRLFVHVAEAASITHGAQRANLSLAAASERIRGMEEAIGVALLHRQPRGVSPTPAGRTLVHHARTVLRQLDHLRSDLSTHADGIRAEVRLWSNTAALTEFLPEALAAFLAVHPRVDIALEEQLSHEIVRAVAVGATDIGIVADAVDVSGLETFPFRDDRLVLVVRQGHRLTARAAIPFRRALDHGFVGLSRGSALQDYLDRHAAQAGQIVDFRVRVRSFDAICRIVEQGVGIGVVPETAARRCAGSMAISAVPLSDAWALRQLVLCVRRYADLPLPARALVDHLRAPAAGDREPLPDAVTAPGSRAADGAADNREAE